MAKLTAALVEKLWNSGDPHKHIDGSCPGLYFKVTRPKAASWVLRYQLDGKRVEMGLGPYPALGLADARTKAREQRKLVRVEKIDPLTHRQSEYSKRRAQDAKRYTVEQLVEEYAKVKSGGWGYWMVYAYQINMKNHVLPVIGDVLVRDVNVGLVRQVLDPIWTEKPTLARNIQGDLARLFEYAEIYELRVGNPARGLQNYMPTQRAATHRKDLPYEDMPTFISELRKYQVRHPWYRRNVDRAAVVASHAAGKSYRQIGVEFGIAVDTVWRMCCPDKPGTLNFRKLRAYALEFLILTGPPRTAEILATRWQDIDEDQKILIMPRPRMKVKKRDGDHIIPLSTRALEIIRELGAIRNGNSDYLFPGSTQGHPRDRKLLTVRPKDPDAVGRPMARTSLRDFLRYDFDRDDIDVHGFRKSFSNWAYAAGRFRDIAIELSLDHAYGTRISRVYRDEQLVEERRELLQAWAHYCDGSSADVIKLPVRKRKASA
jgi:integrase